MLELASPSNFDPPVLPPDSLLDAVKLILDCRLIVDVIFGPYRGHLRVVFFPSTVLLTPYLIALFNVGIFAIQTFLVVTS